MRTRAKSEKNSLGYLKMFIFFLIILIILSYLIRLVKVISESTLNTHVFNILLENRNDYLISVDKDQEIVSVISIKGESQEFKSKNKAQLELALPIDSLIEAGGSDENFVKNFFSFGNLIFNSQGMTLRNLNRFDLARIYFYSKVYSMKEGSIEKKDIDSAESDKVFNLLKDNIILNEKISIQIINASDTDGVGGKVSTMLKNVGFNVVSTITADPVESSRIISATGDNATLSRLVSIFGFPIEKKQGSGVSDISILIGKNFYK